MFFVIALIVIIISLLYSFLQQKHSFFEKRGIPNVAPHWFYGNLSNMGKKPIVDLLHDVYVQLKGNGPICGMFFFTQPVFLALEPDVIQYIMVKDFDYFHDRGVYMNDKDDPLSAHLFSLEGTRWKKLRAKLSPTFTSGKMKSMFHLIMNVANEFEMYVTDRTSSNNKIELEWKDILSRFTIDIIGNCAFGIDCNSLRDPNNEIKKIGLKVFMPSNFALFKLFFVSTFQKFSLKLGLKVTDNEVERFFKNLVVTTFSHREKNNIVRHDFVNLLMQLKNKGKLDEDTNSSDTDKLTMDEIAAQCFVFFLAGYETSSTTMTFCLYELARHQDVQDKLRSEILKALDNNNIELTYELQLNMPYLDAVINETLRLYPAVPNLQRKVDRDYEIPNYGISLKAEEGVMIPIYSIQRDSDHFEKPLEFIPERFCPENIHKIKPFTFLPFGDGPRICIGNRFGMMQTRVGIITLIKNFKFTVSENTPKEIKISPNATTLSPDGGMYLNIERL